MKTPHPAKSAEKPEPPAVDISREAVAEWVDMAREACNHPAEYVYADLIEALAADRDRVASENDTLVSGMTELAERAVASSTIALAEIDRLRTFVRSARVIIDSFAGDYPKHGWADREQDPFGAREWLHAESTEIGTARDGGNPKERT